MTPKRAVLELTQLAKEILSAKPKNEGIVFKRDEKGYAKVSFRIRGDALYSLLRLLRQCSFMGSVGHSFTIVLDPNNSEYKREVGFDGDGSDDLKDIEVNGEPLPDKYEW
jgi:hypothetical protein